MKVYNIAISIDNKISDIISYKSWKRDLKKEMLLIVKFMNIQVCNIKTVEKINQCTLTIVSEKDTIYNVSWKSVTLWDESELED